ncbi:MAG: PQQ-binding-like beta-propeller repeat protein, partial [Thermoplasmatota archaeon]
PITLEIRGYKDQIGNSYLPYQWEFNVNPLDISKPSVETVFPERDSYRFFEDLIEVRVVFDEDMDDSHTPIITQINGTDTGGWTFKGWEDTYQSEDTALWTHNEWLPGEKITLELSDYKDEGGNIGNSYEWSFFTLNSSDHIWPSFRHDTKNTGRTDVGTDNMYTVEEFWSYETGGDVKSTPAVDKDGNIYFGSHDGFVYALNGEGHLIWKKNLGSPVTSSPVISDLGKIYVGTYEGVLVEIFNGSIKVFDTDGPIYSSPILSADGKITFGSYDGKVYCLNDDMTLNWSYNTGDAIYSSPAVWPPYGHVYIASYDGKMYSFNEDGSLRWSYDTGNPIHSSPVLTDLGGVIFVSNDNYLYHLNPDGSLEWRRYIGSGDGAVSTPSISKYGDIIACSKDGTLYSFSRSGNLNHVPYDLGGEVMSSPCISGNGDIIIPTGDGNVHSIDKNWTRRWKIDLGSVIKTSPVISGQDEVLVGTDNDHLYKIVPSGPKVIISSPNDDPSVRLDTSRITVTYDRSMDPFVIPYLDLRGGNHSGSPMFSHWTTVNNQNDTCVWNCPRIYPDQNYILTTRGAEDVDGLSQKGNHTWSFCTASWYGTGGNNRHTSRSVYNTTMISDSNVHMRWAPIPIETDPHSSPILGGPDKQIYSTFDHTLWWLDYDSFTGDKFYDSKENQTISSSPAFGPDGPIYFGCMDHGLYSLNPNGTERWVYTTGGNITSSPTISSDGTVYALSKDENLYSIDEKGSLRWKYEFNIPGDYMKNDIWNGRSSPAIGNDGTIYFGADMLYAFDPDGTMKWAYNHSSEFIIESPPVIDGHGNIYVSSLDGHLYSIYDNGTFNWRYKVGNGSLEKPDHLLDSSPSVGIYDELYITSPDGALYSINRFGNLRWKFQTSSSLHTKPAIGSEGTVYLSVPYKNDSKEDTFIYAFYPGGEVKWSYYGYGYGGGSPSIGGDGSVYLRTAPYIYKFKQLEEIFNDIDLYSEGQANGTDYTASEGWNFISIDVAPRNTDLSYILETGPYNISGCYDKVMYYEAGSGMWRTYSPNRPTHFNNLHKWEREMGIWIHMIQNATLRIGSYNITHTTMTLKPGWNMVGYPSIQEQQADITLPSQITKIGVFDPQEEYNVRYISDLSTYTMIPGKGYWVYNSDDRDVLWRVTH